MTMQDFAHRFDVAIIGSGLSGSMLACILSKKSVSVVLIDEGTHPRFAVGESTIPQTSLLTLVLAQKYGVPELENIAYPERIADRVCSTCGIKRAFGFAYHRPGELYDSTEGHQVGTSSKDESHFFRQDIDAYLFHTAVHYGAVPMLKTKVESIEIDKDGVRIRTGAGEEIRARYVVDGTGHESLLAARLNLRENPPPIKHHSRTIFTHMIDVPPFEEGRSELSVSWDQGTLHHVFERGWFWVIPFNNHERSTNPLISVGLTIDPRRYPQSKLSGEQEFKQFLEMFPSVAKQFAQAKAVRPWVSTGRIQYSSTHCAGYRFCLMSHAAGFIDPLFSRGMINTMEVIAALVDPLVEALALDDFDEAAFAQVNLQERRALRYNDSLVNGAFIAWSDFDLWNAWLRVWALGTVHTEFRLMNALADYTLTGDLGCLQGEAKNPVFSNFEDPDYRAFFESVVPLVEGFESGTISAEDAAARIFQRTEEYEFPILIRSDALVRAGWLKPGERVSDRDLQFARHGFRWALTNPDTRDLCATIGNLFRWRAHSPDPHLVGTVNLRKGA
jgi:tetracycline 7-halogenase / FADH2 O2-dependent halogenase